MMICNFGLCKAPWFTGAHSSATFSIAGSSSMRSTRCMLGTAASQPPVLPLPKPITNALVGSGCTAAPIKPLMICVPASIFALPSDRPFTMNVRPSEFANATLLSIPSVSQRIWRRSVCTRSRLSFREASYCRSRPTPISLWRQKAVGPGARSINRAKTIIRIGAIDFIDSRDSRQARSTAAKATAHRRMTTIFQTPGAENHGIRQNPPANEPRSAPLVFHA